jgi:hypothetical protein
MSDDYTVQFVTHMLISQGLTAEQINPSDELFKWLVDGVDKLTKSGSAYGDAWAYLMDKVDKERAVRNE